MSASDRFARFVDALVRDRRPPRYPADSGDEGAMVAAAGFGLWAVRMAQGARFSVPMTRVVMRVSSIAVIVIGLMVTRRGPR